MALYHPGAALLALSILLGIGILGSLQASDTPPILENKLTTTSSGLLSAESQGGQPAGTVESPHVSSPAEELEDSPGVGEPARPNVDVTTIPVDKLTIEQAYLEVHLIENQLTADQKAHLDAVMNNTGFYFYRPNDLLPSSLRRLMSQFRQLPNLKHRLKLGTAKYRIIRGRILHQLYASMVDTVDGALKKLKGITPNPEDKKAFNQAFSAVDELGRVNSALEEMDNWTEEDLNVLEKKIPKTRYYVMELPKIDKSILQADKSKDKPDGAVESSSPDGQIDDSSAAGPELSTIPLDQLTVEQAYLEWYLIKEHLASDNAPTPTIEQLSSLKSGIERSCEKLKPNDQLPDTLRQKMTTFRQAFTNWTQPLKPGTASYQITRAWALFELYSSMKSTTEMALDYAKHNYIVPDDLLKTVATAKDALEQLEKVHGDVKDKYMGKSLKREDVTKLEAAIGEARDAVQAMPEVDQKGKLDLPLTPKPTTSAPESSAGQVWDSAGGGDPVSGPVEVPSDGGQLPRKPAKGSKPRKRRNRLLNILTQPYVWGPAAIAAVGAVAGAAYYFLNGDPVSTFGHHHFSRVKHHIHHGTVASGSSHIGYFLFGGFVALIALGYWWWYCNKSGAVTSPEDDHRSGGGAATPEGKAKTAGKVVSKRASKTKSKQVAPSPTTTTGTPSSVKTTSKKSQQLPATAGSSPSSAVETAST